LSCLGIEPKNLGFKVNIGSYLPIFQLILNLYISEDPAENIRSTETSLETSYGFDIPEFRSQKIPESTPEVSVG
jgi:hypothetical protein